MADLAQKPKKMTVDEFLDWVETQTIPHDLIDGVPRPKWTAEEMMAGGKVNHGLIARNILTVLKVKLRGERCTPYGSDVAVIAADETTMYPDVSVDCGFRERKADARAAVKPVMVVEVLSPSTLTYDEYNKLPRYMETPDIQHILYVSQDEPFVRLYVRTDVAWIIQLFRNLQDVVNLPYFGFSLTMNEIYEDVKFSDEAEPQND